MENSTFIKFQSNDDKVYMLTAIPVHVAEQVFVLELLTDVTSRNILASVCPNFDYSDFKEISTSITALNKTVITDELTKVYNRRYISERLPVEIIRSAKKPSSLIMADIDHFKRVNDQYGHITGDEVLQSFAAILTQNVRQAKEDWIARYGGEEFLICLADCDAKAAKKVAERMRKAVENMNIQTSAGTIKITASFGVHTFSRPQIAITDLLAIVDKSLYKAKEAGRNQVVAN